MKNAASLPALALLAGFALIGLWPGAAGRAQAADLAAYPHVSPGVAAPLPFPRSERAQAVWASDACWNGCQSYCTWGEAACIRYDEQGNCLLATDRCGRACQRNCRGWGGPLVPDIFDN